MTRKRVQAILSDYDGTLVPTANVKNASTNAIPVELEQILSNISSEIPVGVISTKDFEFLKKKTAFARALSCMMGIETLFLTDHPTSRTIEKRILNADPTALQLKSAALEEIAEEVIMCKEFSAILIERKHTSDGILAGLTMDWRHQQLDDEWSYYRRAINHFLSGLVANLNKAPLAMGVYIQKYSEHPFVDIYSIECNKGVAFDTIISELGYISIDGKDAMYLGDSENDNPAFRKAGISIGIRSDARINPKLDCSYFLDYERLSHFLMKLRKNNFIFTDELLMESERYGV
jgi:HAD superfamily hydrolase (TIGR01484 family)